MKQQKYSNSRSSRGFLLSLDAMLGLLIALTIILLSTSTPNTTALERLQLVDLGDAVTTVLVEEGTLDSREGTSIQSRIEELMPSSSEMQLEMTCDSGMDAATNLELPSKKFIASGFRFFAIADDSCFARWWTWSK